jgi:mono/diheme cytochrome c family protein
VSLCRTSLVACVLGLGLLLTGCSDKQEQKASESQTAPASTPAPAPSQQKPQPTATATSGSVEQGKKLFQQTCAACHGMQGQGMPNLGKDMQTSAFIREKSDAELLAFIKKGRMPGDPANTTGVAMPPKGGNPALQDDQLRDIIAYIRTLQKKQ